MIEWEKKHVRIPNHAVVPLYSGWVKFYQDGDRKYFGVPDGFPVNDTERFHFAGFSAEAAQWLIDERCVLRKYSL